MRALLGRGRRPAIDEQQRWWLPCRESPDGANANGNVCWKGRGRGTCFHDDDWRGW